MLGPVRFSVTDRAYRRRVYSSQEVFTLVSLLFILLILGGLAYAGWRIVRAARAARPKTRVIGPDDDPDFLWRLGRGDDPTKR
jgi:hypothetical protein